MSLTRIAKRAGVSIATVSRVVNNSRPVQPDVAAKVRDVIRELHYTPASASRRGRPREDANQLLNIGIISIGMKFESHFEMPVMSSVLGSILSASNDANINSAMTEILDVSEIDQRLNRLSLDGALLFVDSALPPQVIDPLNIKFPVVRIMGGQLAPALVDHVTSDQGAIGFLAAEYLAKQGAKRLGFLTTFPTWDLGKLRAHGLHTASHTFGVDAYSFIVTDDPSLSVAYGTGTITAPTVGELVEAISANKIDGLFVSRDFELAPVYRELSRLGLTACEDIRVVSCDNEQARLSMLHPMPRSIDLNTSEIARQAILRLKWRIQNPTAGYAKIMIPPLIQSDPIPTR